MIRVLILLSAGLGLTLVTGDAPAGCRHVAVAQQAAVVYQPIQQPYYWTVGQNLQDDAQAERIAALVIQKLQAQQQNAPQTMPLTAEVDRWQLVKARCQTCHESNAKAKEAFDLSGDLETLTCEQRLNAIRQLVDGAMPKGKSLPPDELGDLIGAFSGSEKVGK